LGGEVIFKATVGSGNLHEISNYNGTSKTLIVKNIMFPLLNIHKYIWTSDGKTYNQIDHVLIETRRRSDIVDVRSFKGADCGHRS